MNNVTTVQCPILHILIVLLNFPQKFDSVAYFMKKQFHER
jgi:hypothetical protein